MECKQCGNEFEPQRSTALFCSGACRALSTRENKPRALTQHEQQCAANNQTRPEGGRHTINTGPLKSFDELDKNEHNRVSLPFDDDYEGIVGSELVIEGTA